jgi:hypothetical protein
LISTLSVTPLSQLPETMAKYVCNLASLGRTQGRSAFARSANTPWGRIGLSAQNSPIRYAPTFRPWGRADRMIPKRRHTLFTMSKIEEPNAGRTGTWHIPDALAASLKKHQARKAIRASPIRYLS